ncbi:MAG: gliding motility-associated C-terminal domain-containing protein [Cytophagaceae bacterium]|jgi:gliding motility-associated-like protein|nr:gliding motility-associated C-terminal domain-containing protein [Cytophagaceae bacterium]
MKRMKQFLLVFITIFSIVFATSAATFTVTSTADAGAGTLRQAISNVANTTGGPHNIVFAIPAGSVITISSSLSIYNDPDFNGLTINGFIDAVAGPDVIIRGGLNACNNSVNGFHITAPITGLRFYGLVFQSLSRGIFYDVNNTGTVLSSEVKGCYFGTTVDGTAIGGTICRDGISIRGANTIQIGGFSTTLSNGAVTASNNSERCIFGGVAWVSGENEDAAIHLGDENSSSTNISIINNYVGVNVNGNVKLSIGDPALNWARFKHGIRVRNSTNTLVDRNVISGAVGCGMYIDGNSSSLRIKGNKIGTDATGTLAYNSAVPANSFGNMATGIYAESSSSIIIGYDGGILANERNIISGNGGAFHTWGGCDRSWDFNNQMGVYFNSVTNSVIRGNYVGTDVTGMTSTSVSGFMYNRAGGIKLVDGCSGNIIGGNAPEHINVVSGHGLFWNLIIPITNPCGQGGFTALNGIEGGNGIILQYATCTNNTVSGNYIGLASDGLSALGNFNAGIDIQGANGNIIGGTSTALRNYIGANKWGIMMQEDFLNGNSAQSNTILGNWIGLNINSVAVGNGVTSLTEGGGICLQMGSRNNIIGTTATGGGNVISGNKTGIAIRSNERSGTNTGPSRLNTIQSNIIGMNPTLTAAIPNTSTTGGYGYGVQIELGSTSSTTTFPHGNTIGGSTVAHRNIIAGNQKSGIYISHSTALISSNPGNQIIGNFIGTASGTNDFGNNEQGVEIINVSGNPSISGTGTIIRGNVISGNTQNGIALNNSDANVIQTNVIGGTAAATPAALANGQNGIQLTNGSSSNVIGGVAGTLALPTEANFIGFNGSNGVSIAGATSNLNSIHRNSFRCNTLRGIELNGSGNNAYAAPTITGNSTSITVNTLVPGSTIELYSTDGCATCPANPATRLQGLTLVAVGPSPLAFTPVNGVLYVAIAHEANTTTAHNSSEFSQCYSLCTAPTPSISGVTLLCENVTGRVFSTPNVPNNTYIWTVPSGVTITSGAGTNSITVSIGNFPLASNTITVEERFEGSTTCSNTATATLTIRDSPVLPVVSGPTLICGATSTTVSSSTSQPTGTTGSWTRISATAATIATPSAASTVVNNLTVGQTHTFRYTVSSDASTCPSQSQDISIVSRNLPTPDITGVSLLCENVTGRVFTTANNPGSNYNWVVPTGVTITSGQGTNSITVSVGAFPITGDEIRVTESAGASCDGSDILTLTVRDSPIVPVLNAPAFLCGTTSSTVAATNTQPIGTSGSWTRISATAATIATPSQASTVVNNLTTGQTHTFRYTVSSDATTCPSQSQDISIVSRANPSTAVAIVPTEGCSPTTLNLTGNTLLSGETGLWSVTSSTAPALPVITSASSSSTTATSLIPGHTYNFTWTVSVQDCGSTSDVKSFRNVANPTASNAGPTQEVCSTTINLSGNVPTIGVGSWSLVSGPVGPVIADINSPNSSVINLVAGNDYTFRWTIANAPCAPSLSDVIIRTDVQPLASNAGPDVFGCKISSANLNAVVPSVGTALWRVVSGSGITLNDPTNNNATVNGIVTGNEYRLVWETSSTLGRCEATRDTVIVRSDNDPSNVSAGSDIALCNSSVATVTATGSAPGLWTVKSGSSADIANPLNNSTSVTISGNSATLVWSVGNGSCTASAEVTISRTDLPTPAILGDLSHCASTTNIELTATPDVTTSGGSYVWDIITGSGDASITSSTTTNPINVSSGLIGGIVRVRITQGGCINVATQAAITIDSDNTIANAGPDLTTCLDSVRLVGNTPLFGSPSWSVINEPSIVFTPTANNDTTFAETLVYGTVYRFVYTISGACGLPSRDTVVVNAGLTGFVLADVNGPSDTLCSTTARTLSAVVTGGSGDFTYVWTGSNGFRTTTNSPILSVVPNANVVTYQVYVIDNANTGCQTGTDATIVYAVDKQNLEIMNLVTPNNDGKNDIFIVRDKVTLQDLIPQGSYLEVYNRWGDRVFKANDYKNNWNCAELSDGMYFYLLQTECGNQEYKGWVHILGNTNN